MLAETPTERHCTLVYAIARPSSQGIELTLSLAGHHPPLVLRRSGEIEPVGRLGTALGLFERPDVYDSHLTLGPGDLICLFTDGLVEARAGSTLFGADRVAEVLRKHAGSTPSEIAAKLSTAARRFHGSDLTDDLALLIVRADAVLDL
jgi:serine phosphatase RsbU (regulator of sigma subunit)